MRPMADREALDGGFAKLAEPLEEYLFDARIPLCLRLRAIGEFTGDETCGFCKESRQVKLNEVTIEASGETFHALEEKQPVVQLRCPWSADEFRY